MEHLPIRTSEYPYFSSSRSTLETINRTKNHFFLDRMDVHGVWDLPIASVPRVRYYFLGIRVWNSKEVLE